MMLPHEELSQVSSNINGIGGTEEWQKAGSEIARPHSWSPRQQIDPVMATAPQPCQYAADLCCFCFQVLRAHLECLPYPRFPPVADPSFKAPLFVTWLKQRPGEVCGYGSELELRGCIGCLEPISFDSGLSEYAIRSSMKDRRFPPVAIDEVPSLTCRLSILHEFEPCAHAYDWEVGTHGVLLNFSDSRGRKYTATYLPEVAREHGMTREVAIRELVSKSGYPGPCTQELIDSLEVTRYQTIVKAVTYGEYTSLCPGGF